MKEVFLYYFIPCVLIQTIAGQAGILFDVRMVNKVLTKKEGQSFQVKCTLTDDTPSKNDAVFKWFDKEGNVVTNEIAISTLNPYIRTGTGYSKLGFREVLEGDAGKYTCKATVNGQEYEAFFELNIEASLKFSNCDLEQNGLIGSSHAIQCVASAGGLEVGVVWEYNSREIQPDENDNKYRFDSKSLTILNVSLADEGRYSYIASISGRSEMEVKYISFKAVETPRFVNPILEQKAIEGKKVELFCTATGRPLPHTIVWGKEGGSLDITGTDRMTVSDGTRDKNGVQKILTINNVIREDKGKYTCTAKGPKVSGKMVTETQSIQLLVQIPPSIELPQKTKEGVEGQGQTITCIAYGDPAPDMVWQIEGTNTQYFTGTHGNVDVKEVTKDDSNNIKKTFTISFTKLTSDDAGKYICKGMNNAGNASDTVDFIVKYGPKPLDPQGQFYTWKPQKSEPDTETALKCKVKSNPKSAFQWFKDGKEITDNQPYYGLSDVKDPQDEADDLISMSTLTVKFNGQNTNVLGSYVCKAVNHVANAEVSMDLIKAENPAKPEVKILHKEATVYTFLLMENTVQGPPVDTFKVVYSKVSTPSDSKTQEVGKETRPIIDKDRKYTELKVEGLDEDTTYSFTFYAISPVGEGAGFELTETTPSVREPGIVKILTESNVPEPTIIRIRWDKPSTGGAPIDYYKVKYQRVTVEEDNNGQNANDGYKLLSVLDVKREVPTNIMPEQNMYELKGLLPGNYYQISVTAVNRKGSSLEENKIIKTAEGQDGGLSTGAIVGIIIGIFFILLIIVDVTCYLKNSCGILMSIKEKVTGSRGDEGYSAAKTDDVENLAKKDELTEEAKAAEEGEVAEEEKKEPLLSSEEQKVDTVDEGETKPQDKEKEPEEKEAAKPEEAKTEETPAQQETKEEAPATEEKPAAETPAQETPAE